MTITSKSTSKSTSKNKARIVGLGSYLPELTLTNFDLEKMVDTTDDWIFSRTGIKERRIAAPNEFTSDMAVSAALIALKNASISPDELDLILVATTTPDHLMPSTAAIVQGKIGAKNSAAFDVQAACTGFIYALSIAKAYIESNMYEKILLIACDKMSSFIDYQDRNTCVLFGDAAAAAVITNHGAGLVIDTIQIGADGRQSELLMIPAGGSHYPASAETLSARQHYLTMNGKEIFKHAVRRMSDTAISCLTKSGLKPHDIAWFIPHQANLRIIEALAIRLDIPIERVGITLHKYGNTSASSLAIALDELDKDKQINPGDHLLLIAFGAGLTWGASVLTKAEV